METVYFDPDITTFERLSLHSMILGRVEELAQPTNLDDEVEYELFESDHDLEKKAWFRLPDGTGVHVSCNDLSLNENEWLPTEVFIMSPLTQKADGKGYFTLTWLNAFSHGVERHQSEQSESDIQRARYLYPKFLYDDYINTLDEQQLTLRIAALQAATILGGLENDYIPVPNPDEEANINQSVDPVMASIEWVCNSLTEKLRSDGINERLEAEREARTCKEENGEFTPSITELQNYLAVLESITGDMRVAHNSDDWSGVSLVS